jgi:beta-glucanase (GH16 family)
MLNKRILALFSFLVVLAILVSALSFSAAFAATNIAQGKTASADSSETANPAARGNDGNTTTRWCAANGNTGHWWKVDLGASYNLSGSEVMWEFARNYKYKVEVSTDNTTWTLKVDKTANTSTAQTQTDNFTATARYVRITVTGLASGTWASFFEFRVFDTSSGPTPTRTPTPGGPTPTPIPGWNLVWSDEFNGTAIDTTNWGYEIGYKRNNEQQYYTNRPENARIENGNLVIEARRESYSGYAYTSASLLTQGKRQFQYGRFEMRAIIPTPTGSWPAWWTLGIANPWPKNGEIDIMEFYRGMILANIAYQNSGGSIVWDSFTKNISDYGAGWSSNYHIWVMEWDTNTINLYVDGALLNTFSVNSATVGSYNPFRQPHYMIVNLAIGGNNGGDPSGTTFPLRYLIDYVRVYQK